MLSSMVRSDSAALRNLKLIHLDKSTRVIRVRVIREMDRTLLPLSSYPPLWTGVN